MIFLLLTNSYDMKKNIAILMGGYSSEFEISINSGNLVYKNIDKEKYLPYRIYITTDGWYYLDDNNDRFDIDKNDFSLLVNGSKVTFHAAFNVVHGTPGEDGLLQAYFQLIGIPQTACDFYQAALTFNKRDCISALKPYGVSTAKNYFLNKGESIDIDVIIKTVGLPCFIKPNRSGSSYGISKVKTKDQIVPAIEFAYKEDDEIIIESFLKGIEVSVGVIKYKGEIMVLPVTEIVSKNEFFDYSAKYLGQSEEITPARLSETDTLKVQNLAVKIYKTLNIKGLSRSEFIFHNGEPHFLEMNTNPGLSESSILPQQVNCAGISLTELFSNELDSCMKIQG